MIFSSQKNKIEFLDYINFKLKLSEQKFIKNYELDKINSFFKKGGWCLKLKFSIFIIMYFFLIAYPVLRFIGEYENAFILISVTCLISFLCLFIFIKGYINNFLANYFLRNEELKEDDFIELKYFFTREFIDDLLEEYCHKKDTSEPLKWNRLINLSKSIKKDTEKDLKLEKIKQKIFPYEGE